MFYPDDPVYIAKRLRKVLRERGGLSSPAHVYTLPSTPPLHATLSPVADDPLACGVRFWREEGEEVVEVPLGEALEVLRGREALPLPGGFWMVLVQEGEGVKALFHKEVEGGVGLVFPEEVLEGEALRGLLEAPFPWAVAQGLTEAPERMAEGLSQEGWSPEEARRAASAFREALYEAYPRSPEGVKRTLSYLLGLWERAVGEPPLAFPPSLTAPLLRSPLVDSRPFSSLFWRVGGHIEK